MSTDTASNSFRVLIVDDERLSLMVIHHLMESLGAEHIETATSFTAAHAVLKSDPTLKLIVSDHYMPDGCGLRLLGDVRQGRFCVPNDTFFIISTSSKSFALAAVAMSLDVDSFMSKPFTKEELALRLYDFLTLQDRVIHPKEHYLAIDVDDMIATAESHDPAKKRTIPKPEPVAIPLTPLSNVFPDTPLSADLVDGAGTVLLPVGTILSPHILQRLKELDVRAVPVGKR